MPSGHTSVRGRLLVVYTSRRQRTYNVFTTSDCRCRKDVENVRRHDVDMMSTTKSDIFTTSVHCRSLFEKRRRHDVSIMSTTKSDVVPTSDHRCCIDVETRSRHKVDMISTTKSNVLITSDHRRCLDAETRRRHDLDMTSTIKSNVFTTSDYQSLFLLCSYHLGKRCKDTLKRSLASWNIDYRQWTITAANGTNWRHT